MKIYLAIYGENITYCVYHILQGDSFLILYSEYEQKLFSFQKNSTVVICESSTSKIEEKVVNVVACDKSLEDSPWKSIVLENSRISFWEIAGIVDYPVACTSFIRLSKYTKSALFIYYPNVKNYKTSIPMPMYLQLIEQRLCDKFYRSFDAIYFDIELILKNTEDFYGKKSKEYKEFSKIIAGLKDDVLHNVKEITKCTEIVFNDEFQKYLPWNLNQDLIAVTIPIENSRKKLRKLH